MLLPRSCLTFLDLRLPPTTPLRLVSRNEICKGPQSEVQARFPSMDITFSERSKAGPRDFLAKAQHAEEEGPEARVRGDAPGQAIDFHAQIQEASRCQVQNVSGRLRANVGLSWCLRSASGRKRRSQVSHGVQIGLPKRKTSKQTLPWAA